MRKCSALPRSRTVFAKRITHAERKIDPDLQFPPGWDAARPRTREDCAGQPRPCPWVSCRFNLYLDVAANGRGIKLNFPGREPWDVPATGSCALDVADRVAEGEHRRYRRHGSGAMAATQAAAAPGISLAEVGTLMNLSIERVRQISSQALQQARVQSMREDRLVQIRPARR